MPFNKESNGFIVAFVAVMVVIVAVTLSAVTSGLKPLTKKNEMVDKKTKILKSVVQVSEQEEKTKFTADFVLSEYEKNIEGKVVNSKGEEISGMNAFDIDFKKETRKPENERTYPLFVYNDGQEKYYIIPLIGMGLWDEVSGYLALKGDFKTLRGAAFDHKAETPGLGARIVDYWFRKQFQTKKLFNEEGGYDFKILKGENHAEVKTNEHVVDGLSGATLTTQGVDVMLQKCVKYYEPFFTKVKS